MNYEAIRAREYAEAREAEYAFNESDYDYYVAWWASGKTGNGYGLNIMTFQTPYARDRFIRDHSDAEAVTEKAAKKMLKKYNKTLEYRD